MNLTSQAVIEQYVNGCMELWGDDREVYQQNLTKWKKLVDKDGNGNMLAGRLLLEANKCLKLCGVFPIKSVKCEGPPREFGYFIKDDWSIDISSMSYEESADFYVFMGYASLIYHESRHAEQFYSIVKYLANLGATSSWIRKIDAFLENTTPNQEEWVGVQNARWVDTFLGYVSKFGKRNQVLMQNYVTGILKILPKAVEDAYKKKTNQGLSEDDTWLWFNSLYGIGNTYRTKVLERFGRMNDTQEQEVQRKIMENYKGLWEERDAYAVQGLVIDKLKEVGPTITPVV